MPEQPLNDATIQAEAKALLAELAAEMGEELETETEEIDD